MADNSYGSGTYGSGTYELVPPPQATDPAQQARYPQAGLYPNPHLFPGMPAWAAIMSPSDRQAIRAATLNEIPHPELGPGVKFTPTQTVRGQLAFGWRRLTYDLDEANRDGYCITKDWDLAAALRGTGFFAETRL